MKHFVVYRVDNGEVVRSGQCRDDDLAAQGGEGLEVLELPVALDPDLHRVAGGRARPKGGATKPNDEAQLRAQRDKLLRESDWTQLPDSPLSGADKTKWQTYRQQLRDLPQQANPKWPVRPQ